MGSRLQSIKMKTIFILVTFIVAVASITDGSVILETKSKNSLGGGDEPNVKLSLYFESLCPYCKRFITEQLGPNFEAFEKYMEVHLNPFGNARERHGRRFECQHGSAECKGSIIEGCLISKMNGTSQSPVPTIACIEASDPSDPMTTQKCMQDTNVADPSFDDVKTCGEGSEGKELFHLFGQETKNLEPPHQYVPWITFNDKWDEDIQNEATINLKATLCRHFLRGVPECSQ